MAASESEIVAVYPHRWAVPRDAWGHLFGQAEQEIGILVYSCYFLAEDAGLRQLLAEKAKSGVRVRILLGDPESPYVLERGQARESMTPCRPRCGALSRCSVRSSGAERRDPAARHDPV